MNAVQHVPISQAQQQLPQQTQHHIQQQQVKIDYSNEFLAKLSLVLSCVDWIV